MDQGLKKERTEQLNKMLEFLDQDPGNPQLVADTIEAALNADQIDKAEAVLSQYAEKSELTPALTNLAGLIALRSRKPEQAIGFFESLMESGDAGLPTRFNLAWCHALADNKDEAIALLDDQMVSELPQAAALKVQMMHSEGEFEAAMDVAKQLAAHHPDHAGLMAAMSVLAMDVEDPELARSAAEKAGNHPDALTTLATLTLGDSNTDAAQAMFQKALDMNENNPRAWIGKGLTQLNAEDKSGALADLDHGAEMFGDHIGSWIAAGWAYFLAGDYKTARERFQKALDFDGSFAESQGSMAVMDAVDGDIDSARKRAETALRLDRQCFSAALAQSLILQAEGNPEKAAEIIEKTMSTPIDADGKTLADMLVGLNTGVGQAGPSIH